jgi:glycosyltransferase involved in cell wall biosynthesis
VRIGFDAKRAFHNFRGLGNYSRTLIESLVTYYPQHEYYLFTPTIKDDSAKEWLRRFDQVHVVTPKSFMGKQFGSAWRSLFLSQVIKEYNLDIFHGLSHELPPFIADESYKKLVTIHDLIFMRYPEFFPLIDRKVYRRKLNYAVECADLVVAICEQTKRDLIELLNCPAEKIVVVKQSCNPSFYQLKTQPEIDKIKGSFNLPDNFILYVGALEERKNALTLLEAYTKVSSQIEQDLVLVGRGKNYRGLIEKMIREHGLESRVHILDHVDNASLPAIYQQADLFVFPSLFEGWGVPIVEALFSEVPVITSQGSCFSESGGPHSLYIDPHDKNELAQKIVEVLNSSDLCSKMIREGRAYAEQFHWKNTSNDLMNLFVSD